MWKLNDNTNEFYYPTAYYHLYVHYSVDSIFYYTDNIQPNVLDSTDFVTKVNHAVIYSQFNRLDSVYVYSDLRAIGEFAELAIFAEDFNGNYSMVSVAKDLTKIADERIVQKPEVMGIVK